VSAGLNNPITLLNGFFIRFSMVDCLCYYLVSILLAEQRAPIEMIADLEEEHRIGFPVARDGHLDTEANLPTGPDVPERKPGRERGRMPAYNAPAKAVFPNQFHGWCDDPVLWRARRSYVAELHAANE
jgi:hypothetical protein